MTFSKATKQFALSEQAVASTLASRIFCLLKELPSVNSYLIEDGTISAWRRQSGMSFLLSLFGVRSPANLPGILRITATSSRSNARAR